MAHFLGHCIPGDSIDPKQQYTLHYHGLWYAPFLLRRHLPRSQTVSYNIYECQHSHKYLTLLFSNFKHITIVTSIELTCQDNSQYIFHPSLWTHSGTVK